MTSRLSLFLPPVYLAAVVIFPMILRRIAPFALWTCTVLVVGCGGGGNETPTPEGAAERESPTKPESAQKAVPDEVEAVIPLESIGLVDGALHKEPSK